VTASDISNSSSPLNVDFIDDFDINERFEGAMVSKESELQRYMKSPFMILGGKVVNNEFDVLAWWKANQGEYPILSPIVIDLYAFPGMSAEVERVFSGLIARRNSFMDRRNRLEMVSVGCIECLHHWLSSGVVGCVSTAMNIDGLIVIDD
jgi:hypothetical protein